MVLFDYYELICCIPGESVNLVMSQSVASPVTQIRVMRSVQS